MSSEIFRSSGDTYEVVREYARGGMGVTFLVTSHNTRQTLILKHLRMDQMQDWKALELFEREAEVLKQLNHPRIPTYVDYFSDDEKGHFNLVQSFIEGDTMQQWIDRQKPVTTDDFLRYFRQCLGILEYLHTMVPPVVHRDITPKNIILNKGEAYLVDFGSVKSAIRPEATMATTVGTFGYMPPEQIMGRAEPGSDLYSLAMSFIAFASHLDPTSLPLNKKTGQVDVHKVLRHLPAHVAGILESMTRMGLEERVRSAHEALERLDRPEPERVIASNRIKPVKTGSAQPGFRVSLPFKPLTRARTIGLVAFLVVAAVSVWGPAVWEEIFPETTSPNTLSSNATSTTPTAKPVTRPPTPTGSPKIAVGLLPEEIVGILTTGEWQGTIGERQGALTFSKKGSRWTGVLSFDDGSDLKVGLEIASGVVVLKGDRTNDNVRMSSTLYGSITWDHKAILGIHEIVYRQGETSYSSEEAWQMIRK